MTGPDPYRARTQMHAPRSQKVGFDPIDNRLLRGTATARVLHRGQERLGGACAQIIWQATTAQKKGRSERVPAVEWRIARLWPQLCDDAFAGLGEVA